MTSSRWSATRALSKATAVGALGFWLERGQKRLAVPDAALEELRTLMPSQPRYALGAKSGEGRTARGWNVILPIDLVERRFEGLKIHHDSVHSQRHGADTMTETEFSRSAEVFGCGRGLDLLERIAESREGIGTPEVSTVLGVKSSKGIGSRLRATRTEVESHGIRFEHAVVRTPGGRGAGSTWAAGPRIEHALHFLRRTRKWIGQPYDRPREPWPSAGYTGPMLVLVLRALLHSYEFFAIPGGIDEARAIVNDLDDPLIETPGTLDLGEVYIERVEPGDGADEVAVPSGYERHGEWIRGRYDYGSIRTIPSNWSDPRYHLGVSFAEARLAERRLVLRDPVEQTIQAAIDGNRETDGLWKVLDGSKVYRYVNWMGTLKKRYAPPVDLRLRVQCEAVVEPEGRQPRQRQRQRILRFESLRGEEWTGARAECRRQGFDAEGERQLLVEVRYAKDQRNPFERAAARELRRGTGRHAGISPRRQGKSDAKACIGRSNSP